MRHFFIFITLTSVILVLPATTTADELSHKEKLQATINAKAKNGKNVAAQTGTPKKVREQQRAPITAAPEAKGLRNGEHFSPVPTKNEIRVGNEQGDSCGDCAGKLK